MITIKVMVPRCECDKAFVVKYNLKIIVNFFVNFNPSKFHQKMIKTYFSI